MSTLRFAGEVVARSEIDAVPSRRARVEAKELRLATQIIDALQAQWKPSKYHDTYTEELEDLIKAKAKGKKVPAQTTSTVPLPVIFGGFATQVAARAAA
jgi:DNA end-binding protein Ku